MKNPDDSPSPGSDDDAQVIHLPDVIPAVRRVLNFYDKLIAGTQPSIKQLDDAVVQLKALPNIPGRLGRDIALIADGGRGASRNDIVGSLERLRQVAAMNPATAPADQHPATRPGRKAKKPKPAPQATLPFEKA